MAATSSQEIVFFLQLPLEHLDKFLGLGPQLVLVPSDVPVDHTLAVFGIEAVFDYRASVAEVKHELAWPTDNFIAALCYAWDLLYRRHLIELLGKLMLLPHRVHQTKLMFDMMHLKYS